MNRPSTRWTPQQLAAITTTGASLLVSAAAGSGKTSVLAERCVHLVCDAKPRCNINQLLVVTFTEAAAAEMKTRIDQALRNRISQSNDGHLRRQLALLEHAGISTLHSFCQRLLRQHFHRAGLDPEFRVLDGDEAALLRLEVARDLFMQRYDGADAERFGQFVDDFGDGDDTWLITTVVSTYELLRSLVDPNVWMRSAQQRIDEAADKRLEESILGRDYIEIVQQRVEDLARDCADAIASVARMPGFSSYAAYLKQLASIAADWRKTLADRGYDALIQTVKQSQLPRLPTIPNATPGKEAAKVLVEPVQKQFKEGQLADALRFSSAEWQQSLRSIASHAKVFLGLIGEFAKRYRDEKDRLRAVDFADLERHALVLLAEGPPAKMRPSSIARLLHQRYAHVLVDEYQDINEVQDAILHLASHECTGGSATNNLFCVGDVKQSIYGFRLAEPTRFLHREGRFRADSSAGGVIDLQANFRSRGPLIESLNRVFQRLFTRIATDIEYDDTQRLFAKAEFPQAQDPSAFRGAPIELHCLPDKIDIGAGETVQSESDAQQLELERSEREAMFVARRIQQLMGWHGHPGHDSEPRAGSPCHHRMQVYDRDLKAYRPIEYRDMVILLRAQRYHADAYADALRAAGIPVYNSGGAGYFDSIEVRDILSLLRLLDNPRQDIPLAAILRSPLAGIAQPEDALARIRLAYPHSPLGTQHSAPDSRHSALSTQHFHEAVFRYAAEKDDELAGKLRDFLNELNDWRALARQRPIADLIWAIYERTGYLAFCSGLIGGQQRCANLIYLYERARQFGSFSRQGLYRFIHFLESLREEADLPLASDLSEAENVVRIMTIHKSKGLEFPVVILPEMGKRINLGGCAGNILADRQLGLGLCAVDNVKRIRYPSLASTLVSQRLRRSMLAEELRVLYVGMTRAKEHLILVGTCRAGAFESWSRRWDGHTGPLPPSTILAARTMLDWVGPASAMLGESAMQVYDHPGEEVAAWIAQSQAPQDNPDDLARFARLEPLAPAPPPHPQAAEIAERLAWRYPYETFCTMAASKSVTAIAHRGFAPSPGSPGEGRGEGLGLRPMPESQREQALPKPRCLLEAGYLSPTDRGTAVHLFLEHLELTRCADDELKKQLNELVARKLMKPAEAAAVDLAAIRWFLDSEVGHLMRSSATTLYRELPINYALLPLPPGAGRDEGAFLALPLGEGRGEGTFDSSHHPHISPPPHLPTAPSCSPDPLDSPMLRGRIDALVPDSRGFVLIDYKTDDVNDDTIAARVETYRIQLELYARAIEKITARIVHTAHLAFLTPRRIVTLALNPSAAATAAQSRPSPEP